MRAGDLVRFKVYETQEEFQIGLLLRYDKVLKVAEILQSDIIYYAPGRLVETYRRGLK